MVFETNTVVGKAVAEDIKSLSYDQEILEGRPYNKTPTIDIGDYFQDENKQPYKLKDLSKKYLDAEEVASKFQEGSHSAIADARVTMKLYLKMVEMKENGLGPPFRVERSKGSGYKYTPGDVCKCKK